MIWILFLLRTDVITRTLTPENGIPGIRSLITLSTARRRHHIFSALPPGTLFQG